MNIIWVSKEEADSVARKKVIRTGVIIDVGPGIRPQEYFQPKIHICIEPYLPYIERLIHNVGDDSKHVFLNCTWDVAMKLFPAKSVDSVFALDVIEHFDKEMGYNFLEQSERIARRQIVVYTPLDFYPQTYDEHNPLDRWGMGGGYWQAHKSGWRPEDFGDGWEFVCCEAYHFLDQHEQPLSKPIGAFWAFRNLERKIDETVPIGLDQNRSSLISTSAQFFRGILKKIIRKY
jgi:hypothetical protein